MSGNRLNRGFTVIELVIAFAVMVLLILAAIPMFRTWHQSSQLRASAESLLAGLQAARVEAVRSNAAQGVRFVLAGSAWRVERVVDNSIVLQGGGSDLAARAVVTPTPGGTTEIVFTPLGQTTLGANVDLAVTHEDGPNACVGSGGEMRCLTVQVRPGGLVRLCDPSVTTAGDPRQCLP